jgi:hypothetical protein
VNDQTIRRNWQVALFRPGLGVLMLEFRILRLVNYHHIVGAIPSNEQRFHQLALIVAMICIPLPMLFLRTMFKKAQARMIAIGADEGDVNVLAEDATLALAWCYLVAFACLVIV